MKFAIIYTPFLEQHPYIIEKAEEYFESVLAVPIEGVRYEYRFDGSPRVMYKNTELTDFDVVFPRLSGEDLLFSEQLIEILNESDSYVHMDSDSFSISSNKFSTVKELSGSEVKVPRSIYTLSTEAATDAAKDIGYPVTIKLISGYGGKGIMRAKDESELRPIIDTLEVFEQDICLQDFIENPGEDIRILVIGEETYSYKRIGLEKEWRSNISRGGNREEFDAPEWMREMAVKASKLTGFDICGVDIISSDEEGFIVEINASPGITEETSEVVGVDIPEEMVTFVKQKALSAQEV
ncbi:MAG: RimK family alpha-L-glutamate ligase [Candidatus Aenigmatarchaeota archaeon]